MGLRFARIALGLCSTLAAFSGAASAEPKAVLDTQLAAFITDSALRAFLAEEASLERVAFNRFHILRL